MEKKVQNPHIKTLSLSTFTLETNFEEKNCFLVFKKKSFERLKAYLKLVKEVKYFI